MFEENLLDMKIAEVQSLDNIASDSSLLVMESAENPQYLVLNDMNLAFIKNAKE